MSDTAIPGKRMPVKRVRPDHPDWPALWRELTDPPGQISASGRTALLGERALAIVGTRGASSRGLVIAEALARDLSAAGWVIVSGLALGIDGAAHRGALSAGGQTVAVMGTGIDRTYPWQHAQLRRQIDQSGCVITEQPDGEPPYKRNFPKRNRLIAGLVEGVIVVEAPIRSGAMLTAHAAVDLNREVFAVPGPVDHEQCRGCHHLLKEGAALLETAADIHAVLTPPCPAAVPDSDGKGPPSIELPVPGSAARWIWDRIDLEGTRLDELAERWGGGPGTWTEGLLALEMTGLSKRLPGGRLARKIWRP